MAGQSRAQTHRLEEIFYLRHGGEGYNAVEDWSGNFADEARGPAKHDKIWYRSFGDHGRQNLVRKPANNRIVRSGGTTGEDHGESWEEPTCMVVCC